MKTRAEFVLAIVDVLGDSICRVSHAQQPFREDLDFGVTSVNDKMVEFPAPGDTPQ